MSIIKEKNKIFGGNIMAQTILKLSDNEGKIIIERLEKIMKTFGYENIQKVEIAKDDKYHWTVVCKEEELNEETGEWYPVLVKKYLYWDTNSVANMDEYKFVMTGEKTYREWIGQSCVIKNDDPDFVAKIDARDAAED